MADLLKFIAKRDAAISTIPKALAYRAASIQERTEPTTIVKRWVRKRFEDHLDDA
jgi:hypothetical protein